MNIQLWSYNYDPEPTGIAPVARLLAEGIRDRGYGVEVVAAHPHYPEPVWGTRLRPYRETRNGVLITRLPLWIGRAGTMERYRQELSFMLGQCVAMPLLPRPDLLISTSPSFPALLPGIAMARCRRLPWIIWLHDILPDGAAATGYMKGGGVLMRSARRLESAAYDTASRIVVLAHSFSENLVQKGVPQAKVEVVNLPATRRPNADPSTPDRPSEPRLLSMGNIGHSQGLASIVASFEERSDLEFKFVITGSGAASSDVATEIRSARVEMTGVLSDDALECELQAATVGLVSQRYQGPEFNIPSKMMNFMMYGLPILGVVNPQGEVARIIERAGAGWVIDSARPDLFPSKLAEILARPQEIESRGRAARRYAQANFTQDGFVNRFLEVIDSASSVTTSSQNSVPR